MLEKHGAHFDRGGLWWNLYQIGAIVWSFNHWNLCAECAWVPTIHKVCKIIFEMPYRQPEKRPSKQLCSRQILRWHLCWPRLPISCFSQSLCDGHSQNSLTTAVSSNPATGREVRDQRGATAQPTASDPRKLMKEQLTPRFWRPSKPPCSQWLTPRQRRYPRNSMQP